MNKLSKGWTTWVGGVATGLLIIYQNPDLANTIIGALVVLVQSFLTLQHDIAVRNLKDPATANNPVNPPTLLNPLRGQETTPTTPTLTPQGVPVGGGNL